MVGEWILLITLGVNSVVFLLSIKILSHYRLNKKFKKEHKKGFWNFLETNVVELAIVGMFISLVAPDLASLILLR